MWRYKRIKSKKAFTLIEVMVTVAILAFGIVSIYQALFVSVDVYGYYTRYFNTQDWLSEKIWSVQKELTEYGILETESTNGRIVRDHKTFNWDMNVSQIDIVDGLYRVELTLTWLEGGKQVNASRQTYLLSPKLRRYEEDGAV